MAYVKKKISTPNRRKRTIYGQDNQYKTIRGFWQYIFFTDEMHLDPLSTAQGSILREEGTRTDPDNIQERGEKTGVKLHCAAWVTWHSKAPKLEFYNDENNYILKPKKP